MSPLQLGQPSAIPGHPGEARIDVVHNPHGVVYAVRFTCPEFTSLCPVTAQPDFGTMIVDYVPYQSLLESKSLKLLFASYRNHKAFHEDCTVAIGMRMMACARPHWLRIAGIWMPRGGIPIDVVWQSGAPPENVHILPLDIPAYRGR